MKTCTRRFILRLIVGLLTFLIGVAAAVALGGFRPFQGFDSPPTYRYRSYRYYKSEPADVDRVYPSCPAKRGHAHVGELPPLADAPLPPPPPAIAR